ncbi:RNA polymerase sigma factor [Anaeromyxobacter oryzisoli]|jgi:RNA polymerase sigma-70 factor, ECF subfamily|uniref:RNA polymerase sigma factor n=1 Tax=Anaeromyxobacter oryzisoli TaxID=2925408 RepID=UPI001F59312C|nr:sigma-70 family RNA polymerase sigma factor [Anaeromyxobacter sp. SG63]
MTTELAHLVPHSSRTRADDAARWAALSQHARLAAAAVLRLPVTHPDVEDRAQDALVAFLASGLPRFDSARGTPEALLGVIARNAALSELRTRARHLRLADPLRSAEGTDADRRRAEARSDLARILQALPAGQCDALVAIDLEGERIADVARRLGRTYTAVNAQVGHARAHARRVARALAA